LFNEKEELEKTKEWLLQAVRGDKVNPAVDAYNYVAAYAALVSAELAREKAEKK
jgi:hypothetical protein